MARQWDTAGGVVTPEAVTLEFAEANVGSRSAALLIDAALLGVVLGLMNWAIALLVDGAPAGVPDWVAITALLLLNFIVFFGYPIAFETLWRGRTVGKAVLGLRVVTVEGAPVKFRHAAIRAAFWLVDFFFTAGMGAVFATLLSRRHQRLGDMVAGTVVLRERTANKPPRAAEFTVPEGAEEYAATIDPAGLSTREYETVREFLLRAQQLDGTVRSGIAQRLAATLAAKLNHTPPEGVEPWLFLWCLAARYQQRQTPGAVPLAASPLRPTDTHEPAPADPGSTGDFAPPV